MYEAHFGVPMSGAVINAVNIRLNAPTIGFLLEHSSSAVIIVVQGYFKLAEEALKILKHKTQSNFKSPHLIVVKDESIECDPNNLQYALRKGAVEYEKFLESGDPGFVWKPPQDEWQSIALGYTSGTTSSPKGVVLHHRGAYLTSTSNVVVWVCLKVLFTCGLCLCSIATVGVLLGLLQPSVGPTFASDRTQKPTLRLLRTGGSTPGDLAMKHLDGYIEIKDRSKDIIISGGENISSVEVENALYQHPLIAEASVVARPDERWGESPCAFVTLKTPVDQSDESKIAVDIMKFGRANMPGYWVPKSVVTENRYGKGSKTLVKG
ncbi:hypothetical protein L1987_84456 [Smallanthus sonchifolius]|uniref:Uncharacterized protein n=1 Tax=Smallanthus sonchifolius TaxID=185202 RepID=A0ACB8YEU5_9ASTR|nr:hypothetical protein L1987_84456 [Smallanthus sonchifolius]